MGTPPLTTLRRLRLDRNWTQDRAADEMGVSRGQYIKLERGERRLNSDTISRAATAFGVDRSQIVSDRRVVPVVGYVGAGAEAHFHAQGQGVYDEVEAPEGSTDDTVAVIIRGESLGSFFDQWLVFYDDVRTPPTVTMLNRLCVVGLPDERVLVKKLVRGGVPGRYTLHSQFEPPIYDVEVAWAALVKTMSPR